MKKLRSVAIVIKDVIGYRAMILYCLCYPLKILNLSIRTSALQFILDQEATIIGSGKYDEFAIGSKNENSAYEEVLNTPDESKVSG